MRAVCPCRRTRATLRCTASAAFRLHTACLLLPPVKASSHRHARHDVLSCLVGGVNWALSDAVIPLSVCLSVCPMHGAFLRYGYYETRIANPPCCKSNPLVSVAVQPPEVAETGADTVSAPSGGGRYFVLYSLALGVFLVACSISGSLDSWRRCRSSCSASFW